MELAKEGIRVNIVAPDAVFGTDINPSGLWGEVGPDRAKAHGIDFAQLEEHYRNRNLLRARVTGRHVGNAVVFFATNRTPTTGATLPVDGGIANAFPR
jgi:NAD(P)-dependent dehydrogenase (short-subunit alcohol dehydrogenase family)